MEKAKTIQSIDRAVDILKCFYKANLLGITDLSRMTGMHKSTVSNIVLTLEANGFLQQNGTSRKYELGMELSRLAANVSADIRTVAKPYLCAIRDACRETVSLGVCQGMQAMYIDSEKGFHSICSITIPGTSYATHSAAFGRIILAYMPEQEREQLLEQVEFVSYTKNTICDMDELREILAQARIKGYTVNMEETEVGHVCIAAPVLDSMRYPVASICVSGPATRINGERIEEIAEVLKDQTRELSWALGCQHPNRKA